MEYCVVMLGCAVMIVSVARVSEGGGLHRALQGFFQRLQAGISLPVP